MDVRRACHCTYRIRYHMVFVVKYRKSLITTTVFDFMREVCEGIEKRYFLKFDAMGFEDDHVHVVVEGPPKYSPSRVMQICKSILAIQIFKEFSELKEELWGGEFWTDGGHIDTVGDGRGLDEVKKYVVNQGRKAEQLNIFEF